jgi:hypothetical protein
MDDGGRCHAAVQLLRQDGVFELVRVEASNRRLATSSTLSDASRSREPAMTQKFTQAYLDELFSGPEFMKLAEIAGYFRGAEEYCSDEPDFGLPSLCLSSRRP